MDLTAISAALCKLNIDCSTKCKYELQKMIESSQRIKFAVRKALEVATKSQVEMIIDADNLKSKRLIYQQQERLQKINNMNLDIKKREQRIAQIKESRIQKESELQSLMNKINKSNLGIRNSQDSIASYRSKQMILEISQNKINGMKSKLSSQALISPDKKSEIISLNSYDVDLLRIIKNPKCSKFLDVEQIVLDKGCSKMADLLSKNYNESLSDKSLLDCSPLEKLEELDDTTKSSLQTFLVSYYNILQDKLQLQEKNNIECNSLLSTLDNCKELKELINLNVTNQTLELIEKALETNSKILKENQSTLKVILSQALGISSSSTYSSACHNIEHTLSEITKFSVDLFEVNKQTCSRITNSKNKINKFVVNRLLTLLEPLEDTYGSFINFCKLEFQFFNKMDIQNMTKSPCSSMLPFNYSAKILNKFGISSEFGLVSLLYFMHISLLNSAAKENGNKNLSKDHPLYTHFSFKIENIVSESHTKKVLITSNIYKALLRSSKFFKQLLLKRPDLQKEAEYLLSFVRDDFFGPILQST